MKPELTMRYLMAEYPMEMVLGFTGILFVLLVISSIIYNNRRLRSKNEQLQQALDKVEALTVSRDNYKQEAETDPLTGLLNKAGTKAKCAQVLAHHRRDERMALCIIDLDHFKEANDTYGHLWGDELLTTFAKNLKEMCKDAIAIGRFGGDEFVMLVPLRGGVDNREIERQTGELLEMIAGLRIKGKPAGVFGSIGIAIEPAGGISYDELFRYADYVLYQVKKEGRNGCRIYNPVAES